MIVLVIFDIETNAIEDDSLALEEIHTIHVIALYDYSTDKLEIYDRTNVRQGIERLTAADCIVGHNIIQFDIPVINKLYPDIKLPEKIIDTLVLGKLAYPDIMDIDMVLWRKGLLPAKFIKKHSLAAYGYRLGIFKGNFREEGDFNTWTPAMSAYCGQDVCVNKALLDKLLSKNIAQEAIDLEHSVAKIIKRQMWRGVTFDKEKAELLYANLIAKRQPLQWKLKQAFPVWFVRDGKTFIPKRTDVKRGYAVGCPVTKVKLQEFNPTSRHHIAYWLDRKYGWKPSEYNADGSPVLDDEVIKELPYSEAPMIAEHLMIDKRIGQLAEGKQAWLKKVAKDGKIHGFVNTLGAVTRRMTHLFPNMAQVPKVSESVPYGYECRDLFIPTKGFVLVGVDTSGLELRCLGHYMAIFDEGAYAKVILEGDIHTVNQEAAGLPTRDKAKRFIYAFLYGAGDVLLGSLVGGGAAAGKAIKKSFLAKTPALAQLIKAIQDKIKATGMLRALDGGLLKSRSLHSALNLLLQSAGALIMKKALVLLDESLQFKGFVPSVDYEFVLNIHDEFQIESLPKHAELIGQMAIQAIKDAGVHFKFRCPLDGEYKIGKSWAETH